MAIYKVRTSDGCRFRMKYNAEHPRSSIVIDCTSDLDRVEGRAQWVTIPYQVADARDARHAAELAQEYLDDGAYVESVEEIGR